MLEGEPVGGARRRRGRTGSAGVRLARYGPLGALLLGSVSRPLLHRATSPLLVIPRGHERDLERLLCIPRLGACESAR